MTFKNRYVFLEAKSQMTRCFSRFFQLPQIAELKGGVVLSYQYQRSEVNKHSAYIELNATDEQFTKICDFWTQQHFKFKILEKPTVDKLTTTINLDTSDLLAGLRDFKKDIEDGKENITCPICNTEFANEELTLAQAPVVDRVSEPEFL